MSRPFNTQNMMTEHLQSIRDLDLELELLKRKRELMEQQHQISNIRQNQYGYNQPERYQRGAQTGSDHDYANLYQDPAQSNYRDRFKPAAKKRLGYNSNNTWNEAPPPKRSFGPPKGKFGGGPSPKSNKNFTPVGQPSLSDMLSNQRPNQRPLNHRTRYRANKQSAVFVSTVFRPGSGTNNPESLKPKSIGQRIKERKQTFTPKKDFTPTKVNKSKKKAPLPNKDKLVAEALKIHHEKEGPILHPDKVPTQQMAGRLELALGRIMKDIKEVYEGNTAYVNSFTPMGQRTLKQAIRERLRGVMLGKPVGHLNEIVNFYRQTYPKDTDIEIVKMGASKPSNDKQDAIKVAGEYFKKNMYQLLNLRLDDLFKKIQSIYKQEREAALKEKALNETPVSGEKPGSNEQSEINGQPEPNEQPVSDEQPESKEQVATNEQSDSMQIETPHKQDSAEVQETFVIQDDDKQVSDNQVISVQDVSETPEAMETESTKVNESNATMEILEIKDDDNDTGEVPKDAEEAKQKLGFDIYELYDKLMNSFLDERLPKVLPTTKYKHLLMNTLDIDLMYEKKKFEILRETRRLIQKGYGVSQESSSGEARSSKGRGGKTISPDDDDHLEKPRPAYAPLPYYVKIIGKPSLPKRQTMQGFLDQFHPKSIKKVKSLRNLLFAGFDSKEDFDGIVAATGTVIGNDTLTVKVSKWVTNKTEDTNEGNDSVNDLNKTQSDSLINSDLDSQISDVLSTIKNEEENKGDDAEKTNETGDNKQDDIVDCDEKMDTAEEAVDKTANEEDIEQITNAEVSDDLQKQENADIQENNTGEEKIDEEKVDEEKIDEEKNKSEAKESVATPTRASTRLASGAVRTRRASRLAQN